MNNWYQCKVKHNKENADGIIKPSTNDYLVSAISYTEAEARIYEQMEINVSGEFSISAIIKTNISEVVSDDKHDDWFKCKVQYSTVDGDSEKEVKVTHYVLVCGSDLESANASIKESLKNMLVPFDIPTISKIKIEEVFITD